MASPLTGEYQFGVGSLVCGYDTVAPEVSIVKISGLGPSVIAQTANRAFSPGAAVGVDTSGPRMVELDVEIFTPGDDEDAGAWWVIWMCRPCRARLRAHLRVGQAVGLWCAWPLPQLLFQVARNM